MFLEKIAKLNITIQISIIKLYTTAFCFFVFNPIYYKISLPQIRTTVKTLSSFHIFIQ